jgi:salicylate hydroxylase
MKIVIIGAGIAGLATARALSVSGLEDYTVLEQAEELTAIGAGIQLTNNATRVLKFLGLIEDFIKTESQSQRSTYRDLVTDEEIFHVLAGEHAEKRYGTPYFQVTRQRLVDILRSRVEPQKIRLNARCQRVTADGDKVVVEFASGERLVCDVLIGADGMHSVARQYLVPPSEPVFSGLLGWRALIPFEKLADLELKPWHYQWMGPNRSVTSYRVQDPQRGPLLNFLGVVPSEEVQSESWRTEGDVRKLRASFKGACERLRIITERIEHAFITGIFDRPPLEHCAAGRVALVGDAAHPVWPFLANGAAQALEDTVVIARCLARNDVKSAPAALREYEQRRLPRANFIQRRSRMLKESSYLSDPEKIAKRNEVFRARAAADPTGAWSRDWLWGYNVVEAADAPLDSVWREPQL